MTSARHGYFEVRREIRADTGVRDVAEIGILRDARVVAMGTEIESLLRRWLEAYPAVPQNRVPSVSLTCSAMCVDFGVRAAMVAAKVTVLLFAIDDIVDGATVEPSDAEAKTYLAICRDLAVTGGKVKIEERTDSLDSPLASELVAPWFDAARAFQHYCIELATFPNASIYYPFFARTFAGAMNGMIFEVESRRAFIETGRVPDYNQYIDAGKKSIASPIVYAVVLAALAPPLDPLIAARHAEALDAFAFMGGVCVRLANDVRSFTRESRIEQRPNSMTILMNSRGMGEAEAEAEVIRLADAALLSMVELSQGLPEVFAPWADSVRMFTALMRDWYMVREFHDMR